MQNTKEYNLLYEPWIECHLVDDSICHCGLLDFNVNINKISYVRIPLIAGSNFPFYELAFWRFIHVLYSSALMVEDDRDCTIGFSDEEINAVAEYLRKWEHKFNLMDDEYPFMQCTKKDRERANITATPDEKGFVTSFVHLPSENALNTKNLLGYDFRHSGICIDFETEKTKDIIVKLASHYALSPKEAIYHLLYLCAFAQCAGQSGCSTISQAPDLYILLQAPTVGQSVKMNLIPSKKKRPPIWEKDGIFSYYERNLLTQKVNYLEYAFYPSRFCLFDWDDNNTTSRLLYAPHAFSIDNTSSKQICKEDAAIFYKKHDRDALIDHKGLDEAPDDMERNFSIKYNRVENWLTMLMSIIINDNGALHSDIAPRAIKEIINEDLDIPENIKIVMYGRKTDIKKGVYYYVERMEENIRSKILRSDIARLYLNKYIRHVRAQFRTALLVVNKFYKLRDKQNAHQENKVPFISQCISTYARKRLQDVYAALENEETVEEGMKIILTDISLFTKNTIFSMLSEDVLTAARAYNLFLGGKK